MKQRYRNWRTSWYLPKNKMDDLKKSGCTDKTIFVFMVCISVKWKIRSGKNQEQLKLLQQQEKEKSTGDTLQR